MRYYQKTKEFNEELPIESLKLFKYAIMIHFILSAIMYTGSSVVMSHKIQVDDFEQVDD